MKSKNIFIFILVLFIAIEGIIFLKTNIAPESKKENITQIPQKSLPVLINEEGNVSIEVKPQALSQDKEAIFNITLSTHSVELDYDLVKISKLIDSQGKIYKPTSWTGGSGGHHLSGTLSFPKIGEKTRFVTLVISEISGVERKFNWSL